VIGRTIGQYQIIAELGRGGMGEVYRAHDARLGRDAAIKILPEAFLTDADRVARFEREARTLASLNHPNIAQIYGIEQSASREKTSGVFSEGTTPEKTPDVFFRALVMELVEGEDLSALLERGPVPLADALPIARQIIDALEAAHEQGIVHRDLKPANVKVRPDGTVKVLDFGLARPGGSGDSSGSIANSPTMTSPATAFGMIIGTAAYMSPEQARGRVVDRRADIWAFGVVLYEMLSGRRAFEGEDISITLANVMKDEVAWDALPKDLLAPIARLLRRCLEKDPKKRLSSIGDARLEIDEALTSPAPDVSGASGALAAPSSRGGSRLAWLVASAAGVGLAALAYLHFTERPPEPALMHVSLPIPAGGAGFLGVSPDGRRVLAGMNNLAVRDLDAGEWTSIESARGARTPFWSPDGRSIGFFADGKLKTVSAAGGPARELCAETGTALGGTWRSDGVILFASTELPLRQVSASGGACTPVMKADPQRTAVHPTFLPDGVHYLYAGQIRGDLSSRGVYVGSLAEPDAVPLSGKKVLDDYSGVLFAPSADDGGPGHLLFLRGSNIMAQRFDAGTLTVLGDPFLVAPNGGFSLSAPQLAAGLGGGTLIYGSNLKPAGYQPVWIDRAGKRLSTVAPVRDQRGIGLSSDGLFATLTRVDEGLRVFDLARNTETRVSSDASPTPGVWSRDGKYVVFSSTIDGVRGIYRRPADGSGKEELLLPSPANTLIPADVSQTGTLFFVERHPKTDADIWYWLNPADASTKPEKFLAGPAMETQPQLSPDGRWLAYVTNEGGGSQVTVRRFPSGEGFVRVGLGVEPRWKKDGSELYFLTTTAQGVGTTVMAVPIRAEAQNGISVGTPVKLFQFESLITIPQGNSWLYAPSPDGQRFLVSVQAEADPPTIHMITNWLKAARGAVK